MSIEIWFLHNWYQNNKIILHLLRMMWQKNIITSISFLKKIWKVEKCQKKKIKTSFLPSFLCQRLYQLNRCFVLTIFFQDFLDTQTFDAYFLFWRQFLIDSVYWCFHEKNVQDLGEYANVWRIFFGAKFKLTVFIGVFTKKWASFRGSRKGLTHCFGAEFKLMLFTYCFVFTKKMCKISGLRNRLTHFFLKCVPWLTRERPVVK